MKTAGSWFVLSGVCLVGMALRPTWNDSDYYIQVVNLAFRGIRPHIDYPHIYTLLSTWMMMPLKTLLGEAFSPTTMSVLVGVFYLTVAWLVFRMLGRLGCPACAAHAGAALSVFLGISSGHFQFTLEPWCVLFGTLSLWCVVCGHGTWTWAALSGACAAATFLCKQNGGIFLPVAFVVAWVFRPREDRARFLVFFGVSAMLALAAYLLGTRLWLGNWSALPTFLGQVPYSRSVGVARGEAAETLTKAVAWAIPVWLAVLLSGHEGWRQKGPLLFGCFLLIPAVIVSPGDHNRYFVAPFLGLLLGLSLRDRPHRWLIASLGVYVAETVLRCALYFGEPMAELCNHGSVYSKNDVELVTCLRKTLTRSDRLLVVPQDGGTSVARFYVLTDSVPANLIVRHNENLGWGTEFIYGEDELIAQAVSNATCLVVHRPTDLGKWVAEAEKMGMKKVGSLTLAEWDVFRR